MEILEIKDLPDGGADVTFECTPEEKLALFRYGFVAALKDGIKYAEEHYTPEAE